MFKALVRQFNIVKALAIYDLQGQFKSYNYGFAWTLIEPLIYIVAFRMARKVFGGMGSPSGMTPIMFYVLGVFPLYFFIQGMSAGKTVAGGSRLLYFPRVSQLDQALGVGVSGFSVNLILFMILAPCVAAYEGVLQPENVNAVLFAVCDAWLIGIGLGLTVSGLLRVFPPMKQFLSYLNFGIRMASGMFFCARDIPSQYWPYLSWNPLFHVGEMSRDGWFETYTSPIASPSYMLACTMALLLMGLSVERFMRRVPYV